jgi:hypothetical protein
MTMDHREEDHKKSANNRMMSRNIMATSKRETDTGAWLSQACGIENPIFGGDAIFHHADNPYSVELQHKSWVTDEKNLNGVREVDLFFEAPGGALCFGSVKMRFTSDYLCDLETALTFELAGWNIKVNKETFATKFPDIIQVDKEDGHVSLLALLPPESIPSLHFVGLAVTGVPNRSLDVHKKPIVVVESLEGHLKKTAPAYGMIYNEADPLAACLAGFARK